MALVMILVVTMMVDDDDKAQLFLGRCALYERRRPVVIDIYMVCCAALPVQAACHNVVVDVEVPRRVGNMQVI